MLSICGDNQGALELSSSHSNSNTYKKEPKQPFLTHARHV